MRPASWLQVWRNTADQTAQESDITLFTFSCPMTHAQSGSQREAREGMCSGVVSYYDYCHKHGLWALIWSCLDCQMYSCPMVRLTGYTVSFCFKSESSLKWDPCLCSAYLGSALILKSPNSLKYTHLAPSSPNPKRLKWIVLQIFFFPYATFSSGGFMKDQNNSEGVKRLIFRLQLEGPPHLRSNLWLSPTFLPCSGAALPYHVLLRRYLQKGLPCRLLV